MPFLVKVPNPHKCDKPNAEDPDYWIGTKWQCDICGTIWELKSAYATTGANPYWDPGLPHPLPKR